MSGRTFKRCGCRDEQGKQFGTRCPKLRQKNHGAWTYVVDIQSADGKRRQHKRGGFRTKTEAEAACKLVADHVSSGMSVDYKLTVGAWLDYWLAEKTKASGVSSAGKVIRPSTARSYRHHIEDYLKPRLGAVPLSNLTGEHISTAYDSMMAESAQRAAQRSGARKGEPVTSLGPATLRRIHATLSSALNRAVKTRKLAYNPAQQVDLPEARRPEVTPWEPAELGQFLDYAMGHRFGIMFELIAATGLRRGETLGLRWSDLDAVAGVLTINQQLVDTGTGAPTFGPPKTAAGQHRRVELDRRTVGALLVHRLTQDAERRAWGEAYQDQGLVFAQENGRPYDPAKVTKTFTLLARESGLRTVRLHDLRHGSASLMLAAGIPVEVVSKRLGHSSITLTLDTYSHLLGGVGRQAAEAASALVPRSTSVSDVTARGHNVTTTGQHK